VERLKREPGLDSTVFASNIPAGNSSFWNERLVIDGKVHPQATNLTIAGPGYFKAMEIPMAFGRDFDARDTISTRESRSSSTRWGPGSIARCSAIG
jgi:hypothetical protein